MYSKFYGNKVYGVVGLYDVYELLAGSFLLDDSLVRTLSIMSSRSIHVISNGKI